MTDKLFAEINLVHGPLMAARVIEWVYRDPKCYYDRLVVVMSLIEKADIDEERLESMMRGDIIIGLMPFAWWKKEYRKYIHLWWASDKSPASPSRREFFGKLTLDEFKGYAKRNHIMIDTHIIKIQEIFTTLTNQCPVDYAIKVIDWINKNRYFRSTLFDIIIQGRIDSGLVDVLDDLIGIDPKGLSDFQKAVLAKAASNVDWKDYYDEVIENMWEAEKCKMESQIDPCFACNITACPCRREAYIKGVTWDQFFEYIREKNLLLNK